MDPVSRWIAGGYASRPDMDDRRWLTGVGSQDMEQGGGMTINLLPIHEGIEFIRGYTFLEMTYYDFKLQSYN